MKVTLAVVAPGRRYHVALVDPLPAGFESLNPVLAGVETAPGDCRTMMSGATRTPGGIATDGAGGRTRTCGTNVRRCSRR